MFVALNLALLTSLVLPNGAPPGAGMARRAAPFAVRRSRVPLAGPYDTPLPEELGADAAALLEEADGDVEKARTSYVGYTLAYLEEAMPDLYRQLKTDATAPEAHAALVEVTWDAIAAFMPVTHSSTPSPEAAQRLTAVCRAALPDGTESLLDVGCGHGVLLPFAQACGLPAEAYRGIDLSSGMIGLAQNAHGRSGAVFEEVSFEDECARGAKYDSILFNGALQFFDDQEATLTAAAGLLSDSPSARLVVSHISGASFVRKEFGEAGATVRNTMPFLEMMQRIASKLGLQVVLPSFLGSSAEEIDAGLEDFYLVILVKGGEVQEGESPSLEMPKGLDGFDVLKVGLKQ
jgi:2-polyprenyl-3-methyl-5-hydroxy-6-metoxy-1,4-benzoquinol methylase